MVLIRSAFLRLALIPLTPLLIPGLASAAPFTVGSNTYDVQSITGTGTNHSLLDINIDPTHVFLFGYQWSGSKTGFDLFTDIAANSAGQLAFTYGSSDFGSGIEYFVNTITYTPNATTYGNPTLQYYGPWSYQSYFLSSDGQTFDASGLAINQRALYDGSWDVWALQTDSWDENFNPTDLPSAVAPLAGATVPEPATLGLMALSAVALLRRRVR